ncbi:MAG: VOC family protein [Candidatus Geothermincolia bacterium]
MRARSVRPTLPVVDLRRARAFYEEKLGFEPVFSSDQDVYYRIGDCTGIYLYVRKATKAEHTEAAFHVDDVEREVNELRGKGVVFEEYDTPEMGIKTSNGIAMMDGFKAAWFKDTEGNILEIDDYSEAA